MIKGLSRSIWLILILSFVVIASGQESNSVKSAMPLVEMPNLANDDISANK